jgi:hypothetical protein
MVHFTFAAAAGPPPAENTVIANSRELRRIARFTAVLLSR